MMLHWLWTARRYAIVGCGLILAACQSATLPSDVSIGSLLIDVTDLPSGWNADPYGPQPIKEVAAPLGSGSLGAIDSISMSFVRAAGDGTAHASETAHRFRDYDEASKAFGQASESWFVANEYDTPWQPLATVQELHPSADELYVGCSNQGSIPTCQMIGRYGEFLVGFSAQMAAYDSDLVAIQTMTTDEFTEILKRVDEHVTQLLSLAPTGYP